MLYTILAIVIVLVVGVVAYASTKPDDFRYERKILINAPAEVIFPYLNNTRQASEWSPWEKKDPDMKKTYSGTEEGAGAVYEWSGNREVGAGRLTITQSVPNQKVVMALDFYKPFKGHNTAEYSLVPQGEATLMTWSMYGPNPLMGKIMSLFIDCEKMVGREFEKGLAALKVIAEK